MITKNNKGFKGSKRSKAFALFLAMSMLIGVTGCGESEIKDKEAMTLEEVAAINMQASVEEQESYIYSYITDRVTVNTDALVQASDEDKVAIQSVMDSATKDLMEGTTETLSETDANYILYEMTKTPYQWKLEGTNILGYDATSRLYFVDVTYKTTNARKIVIPNEKIVKGEPDYDVKMQARYESYMELLELEQDIKEDDDEGKKAAEYQEKKANFETIYGKIDDLLERQQNKSLLERTKEARTDQTSIGVLTYNGINNGADTGATMTFRFILNYSFNLGEVTGIDIASVYLKDYKVDNFDTLAAVKNNDIDNYEMIAPVIDSRINAYHKCSEVIDNTGLYNMFDNYADWEKYYDDNSQYALNKYMSYTYEVLDRRDGNLDVLVKRSHKVRSYGSNMSFPSYNEVALIKMAIAPGDKINIVGETLLSSEMVGEPVSAIRNVSGVSEKMMFAESTFTQENKTEVEELVKGFSEAQVSEDDSAIIKYVDLGINQNKLTKMNETISGIDATKKIIWITGYTAQSNMYCSLTVREVNYTVSGEAYEVEYQLELAKNKNGWGIVGYTVLKKIKIDGSNVNVAENYCTVERGKETVMGSRSSTMVDTGMGESGGVLVEDNGTATESSDIQGEVTE